MIQPEHTSINTLGETLNQVIASQNPEATIAITDSLTTIHHNLETALGPNSPNIQSLLAPLGLAAAKLSQAAEAQTSLGNSLRDYLANIGWTGEGADSQEPTTADRPAATPTPSRPRYEQNPNSPESFIEIDRYGTARALDPITGDVMRPGEIPPSLLADPELKQGFDFWKQHGASVPFTLLLTRHVEASDLRNGEFDLRAEAQALSATGGQLFVEGFAPKERTANADQLHNIASNLDDPAQIQGLRDIIWAEAAKDPNFSFSAETLSQIMSTKVKVATPDFITDGDRPADKALAAWHKQVKAARIARSGRSDPTAIIQEFVQHSAVDMGFCHYRNLYLIGKMGAHLSRQYASTGKIPGGASLLIGKLHENIAVTLTDMGVSVTLKGRARDSMTRAQIGWRRRCAIKPEDVRAMVAAEVAKRPRM
ncbi:MAG TPA: hypothetical protein VMR45_00040 [Patescibacteria group bacterium]|nr:hypothetical protein [Patescibacteria group bacterium]